MNPRKIDFGNVVGGTLHGQIVRWQGQSIYAPKRLPPTFLQADAPITPTIPETEVYEAWKTEDGGWCYIEGELARQIEADRKRQEIRANLEAVLTDVMPSPENLTMPYMEGYVWGCGDEWCDCYQAQIVGWEHTDEVGRRRGYQGLWSGSFHTDGEDEIPYAELQACREYLSMIVPSLAARIKWPQTTLKMDGTA